MNRFPVVLLVAFIICLCAVKHSNAQQLQYARKVINTLSSKKYKGRGYVENGANKAASFIAAEFKRFGLHPLGESYFQEYSLSVNTFPANISISLNDKKLKTAVDYLVNPSCPSAKGTFSVFYIKRAELSRPQVIHTIAEQSRGAYLLIDNRMTDTETAEETATINNNILRLQYDEQINLEGLLIYTTDKLTWGSETVQSVRPVITVNNKNIEPAGIKKITIQVDARLLPDYKAKNVVALVKGTQVPDSMLVVTAHYDHLGPLGKEVYFPGANDNASGTALMLCMAKYYSTHPGKYTMVFIAFSGEELGLLGSQAFVNHPPFDLAKIKFLTNFDLAGTGDEGIRVVNGSIFKDRFDKLVQINNHNGLVPKVDIRGEACNSDHCRFYEKGVPSFFIYTQGGIKAYHDIYDKPDTLPLTAFDQYYRLMKLFFDQL